MFNYIWPIVLVVISNVVYQICAKGLPDNMSPLASMTITYLVATIVSAILYFSTTKNANLVKEYSKTNWAPFVLGVVIVGLEVGFLYAYKYGWQVSTAQLVSAAALTVILIFVGRWMYNETLTWNKMVGVGACLVGLFFINFDFSKVKLPH